MVSMFQIDFQEVTFCESLDYFIFDKNKRLITQNSPKFYVVLIERFLCKIYNNKFYVSGYVASNPPDVMNNQYHMNKEKEYHSSETAY